MKRSELIEKLMCAAPIDEDPEVFIDANPLNLLEIDEVDMDPEGDAILIWTE